MTDDTYDYDEYDEYEEKPKRKYADDDITGAPDDVKPARRRGARWPCFVLVGCLISPCVCCALAVCGLAMGVGSIAAVFDHNKVTASHSDTFTVAEDTTLTLEVDNRVGSITVERGNEAQVVVEYKKTAYGFSRSAAQKELDRITVDVDQPTDSRLVVAVDTGRDEDSWFARASSVDLTIRVPEHVTLDLENNVGSIHINGVTVHALSVVNNTGEITFNGELAQGVTDPPLRLETNVGSLQVRLPRGANLEIDARSDVGSVTVCNDFDHISRNNTTSDSVGGHTQATLGSGGPVMTLQVDVGEIDVCTR